MNQKLLSQPNQTLTYMSEPEPSEDKMDLTNTSTKTNPDADIETPPRTQPNKSLSFPNGALKRHHPHHHPPPPPPPPAVLVVSYKECLRNHAASIGGHALDGCGEFMPSPTANPTDPTSLKCAACGCHRNFHRREPDEPTTATHYLNFHHHPPPPPPPPRGNSSSPSSSPPPLQPPPTSYYSSAPHMLLALSTGVSGPSDIDHHHHHHHTSTNPIVGMNVMENSNTARKRFRTKFTQEQKEKMQRFSEKLGWKMQKSDESLVEEFCNEVGIAKGVLKVWMHNNKHTFGKRDVNHSISNNNIGDGRISFDTNGHDNNANNNNDNNINNNSHHNEGTTTSVELHVSANGSSSSS